MAFAFLGCAFVLGAVIGSFLNVVILRTKKGKALTGRSACMHCKKQLQWFELIPIVSFFILRGRCRSCKKSLSIQYPLVEALSGLLFIGIFLHFLHLPLLWFVVCFALFAALWSLLLVIAVYDFYTTIIPNQFVYSFIVLSAFVPFLDTTRAQLVVPEVWHLLAAPILFLPFFLLWYYSRGTWMGLGDGKLAFGFGWMLSLGAGFSALMLGFILGSIVSLIGIALSSSAGKKLGTTRLNMLARPITMKTEVPLAPFLIIGAALVFFFGVNLFELLEKGMQAVLLGLL